MTFIIITFPIYSFPIGAFPAGTFPGYIGIVPPIVIITRNTFYGRRSVWGVGT